MVRGVAFKARADCCGVDNGNYTKTLHFVFAIARREDTGFDANEICMILSPELSASIETQDFALVYGPVSCRARLSRQSADETAHRDALVQ